MNKTVLWSKWFIWWVGVVESRQGSWLGRCKWRS